MPSTILEIPVNSSLNTDTTPNNIQLLTAPEFTFNNAIFYQNALSSLYRHEMESSFITTTGKPLTYSDNNSITTIIDSASGNKIWSGSSIGVESTELLDCFDASIYGDQILQLKVLFDTVTLNDRTIATPNVKVAGIIRNTNLIFYITNDNHFFIEKPDFTFQEITDASDWINAIGDNVFLAVSVNGLIYFTQQANKVAPDGIPNDYGTVWVINETDYTVGNRNGQYLGIRENNWVITHAPIRDSGANYGASNEWQSIYDLSLGVYIPCSEKILVYPPTFTIPSAADLINSQIGPGYVHYVVRYTLNANFSGLFWYDQYNEQGCVGLDLSVTTDTGAWESIMGTFNVDDLYSTQLAALGNFAAPLKTNLRLLINNGLQQSFSYRQNIDDVGVVLAGFTTIDTELPIDSIINTTQKILYKDSEKKWNLITLSENVPYRIQKIADYIYKINTVDQLNVIVENTGFDVQPGSLDWNNRFNIIRSYTMPVISAYTWLLNSGWNLTYEVTGNRSLGYFGPNSQFILRGLLGTDPASYSTFEFPGSRLKKGFIDVYYENVTDTQSTTPGYKYSVNGAGRVNSSQLDGFTLPTVDVGSIMFSIPITAIFQKNSTVTSSVKIPSEFSSPLIVYDNKSYEGYYLSNVVYNSKAFFNILGQNYTYNGQIITLLNQQNGVTISMIPICYALNFRFLGAGLYEAYFYNEFDHDFYVFSGDRQLVKALSFSGLDPVFNSCFSSFDNQLFVFTERLIVIFRNGILYCLDNNKENFTDYYLTELGCWLVNETKAVMFSPNKFDKSYYTITIEPTKIELECLGKDSRTNLQVSRWDLRFSNRNRTKTTIEILTKALSNNGVLIKGPKKTIVIEQNEWDSGNNYSLSLVPQNTNGLGQGFELNTKDYIQLCNICMDVTGAGNVSASIN